MTDRYRSSLAPYRFGWYGQRALDCIGLDRYLDLGFVLSCDFGLDTPAVLPAQGRIFSVEQGSYVRENWTSAELGSILSCQGQELSNYLAQHASVPSCIVAYSATASLAEFASLQRPAVHTIMPDAELKARLDNKISFARAVTAMGLSRPRTFVVRLRPHLYGAIREELGLPFVVQLAFGSSGSSTFFVHDQADLEALFLRVGEQEILVSKFVDVPSVNVNAAVVGRQTLVTSPSVQLVGLQPCTTRAEVYCGNDFGLAGSLSPSILARVEECTHRVGHWLGKLGFNGVFGLDLLVDEAVEMAYPVDLNARFQGSTHLLTQIQEVHGDTPLPILVIASALGLLEEGDIDAWRQRPQPWKNGSQLILHSLSDVPLEVTGTVEPGIYAYVKGSIVRRRPGISLLDQVGQDEFVVSCAVPRPGTLVMPQAPLLKVFTWQSVLDLPDRRMKPWVTHVCELLYDEISLRPPSGQLKERARCRL